MSTLDLISNRDAFTHIWNVAQVYAKSQLIPQHLRGKVEDVFLALTMAEQLGENPVVVMQSIYVVKGRAGWSTQYMIARANRSGVLQGRISWRISGAGDTLSVTAFAKLAGSDEEITATATMVMAKAEGWGEGSNKYKSMPEHMLRWRSAAMLIRLYLPEVMLGYSTVEELETLPDPIAETDGVQVLPAKKGRQAIGLNGAKAFPAPGTDTAEEFAEQARRAEAERVAAEDAAREESERKANEAAAARDAEEQARRAQTEGDDAPA